MKNRSVRIIKAAAALICFAAPCVLYFVLLGRRISDDVILYSANVPWLLALPAGISAYFVLRSRKTAEETDDEAYADSDSYEEPGVTEGEDADSSDGDFTAEYPELYGKYVKKEQEEAENGEPSRSQPSCAVPNRCSADISMAISAQKSEAVYDGTEEEYDPGESEHDKAWRDFLAEGKNKNEEESFDSSVYEDLPDTLPEGFEMPAEDDGDDAEEDEDGDGEEEMLGGAETDAPGFGRSLILRIAAAAVCAASVAAGALMSFVYVAETRDGITVSSVSGYKQYLWSDAAEVTVAPSAWGDGIKAELLMKDGERFTACSDSMLRGKKGLELGGSDIEIYAYIVGLAADGGADVSVKEEKTIISAYSASDDWEYVRQMLEGGR